MVIFFVWVDCMDLHFLMVLGGDSGPLFSDNLLPRSCIEHRWSSMRLLWNRLSRSKKPSSPSMSGLSRWKTKTNNLKKINKNKTAKVVWSWIHECSLSDLQMNAPGLRTFCGPCAGGWLVSRVFLVSWRTLLEPPDLHFFPRRRPTKKSLEELLASEGLDCLVKMSLFHFWPFSTEMDHNHHKFNSKGWCNKKPFL